MRVVIIGARADGHAKVVCEILEQNNYTVAGFIDDDESKMGSFIKGQPVLGTTKNLKDIIQKHKIEGGFAAIGNNALRCSLFQLLRQYNLQLISAIHSSAQFDRDVKLGEGCYIAQNVAIITSSIIGNYVNIHAGVTIDHDNIIEEGANIAPGVHLAGRVKVRRNAFIGTGASVIPDMEIGENSIVGAGSVVIKSIPSNVTAVGNPARIIK